MARKTCSRCRREKDVRSFYRSRAARDGRQSRCIVCDNSTRNGRMCVTTEAGVPRRPRRPCKVCFDLGHCRHEPACPGCGLPPFEEEVPRASATASCGLGEVVG